MKLKVLCSGSSGNCYIIQDNEEALIIEAGTSLMKVKEELGFNTNKVSGCLISHSHGDHSKKARDFEKVFNVYTHKQVIDDCSLERAIEIKSLEAIMVGNFKVLPFPAIHDVTCFGFVIQHRKIGNLMFLTDSGNCLFRFSKLNHIIIECNYSNAELQKSIENGLHRCVYERVVGTHMELDSCVEILSGTDLSNVYNLMLIHLSSRNSDEKKFIEVIKQAVGRDAVIAKPGVEIDLINKPY